MVVRVLITCSSSLSVCGQRQGEDLGEGLRGAMQAVHCSPACIAVQRYEFFYVFLFSVPCVARDKPNVWAICLAAS